MNEHDKVVLWLSNFLKNAEPLVLVPKHLIKLIYSELTKQEKIEPIMGQKEIDFRSEIVSVPLCGSCRYELDRYRWQYCPVCGKAVKWEAEV